ncbi:MAG TPA: hypothetical protein VD788_06745 [Candidatus Polarisedimenticolaceae bacterium]|nr:hypothetical protein [Candidatus Polarisedimenticolaceae bacterium]
MSRRITTVTVLLTLLVLHAACGEQPSPAADPYIERAADREEREALTLARDDIDREQRAVVAQKDAEIERLREEQEELRAKLAARAGN